MLNLLQHVCDDPTKEINSDYFILILRSVEKKRMVYTHLTLFLYLNLSLLMFQPWKFDSIKILLGGKRETWMLRLICSKFCINKHVLYMYILKQAFSLMSSPITLFSVFASLFNDATKWPAVMSFKLDKISHLITYLLPHAFFFSNAKQNKFYVGTGMIFFDIWLIDWTTLFIKCHFYQSAWPWINHIFLQSG